MYYNYIKALHLIFVITWFAGLFYIPRLFIYHIEASKKPKQEADILIPQFKLMARRLWYIITWPSAVLAILFALWLLVLMPSWLAQSWMHLKLSFVVLLVIYHLKTNNYISKFLESRPLRYLGKISYSVYLNHALLLLIIPRGFFNGLNVSSNSIYEILILLVSLSFVLLYSHVTFIYVESKLGKLLRNILQLKIDWLKL